MSDTAPIDTRFNHAARFYDTHAHLQHIVAGKVGAWLADNISHSSLVLDTGAGTGWLARHYPDYQWLLLDKAEAMCHEAYLYGRVLCADARSLPLQTEILDAYLSSLCWQWVTPLPEAILEMQRVLRKHGTGIIATLVQPSLASLQQSLDALHLPLRLLEYQQMDKITGWLKQARLDILHMEQQSFPVTHQDTWALLQSMKKIGAVSRSHQHSLSFTQLKSLMRYHDTYFMHEGHIIADYQVGFWIVQKQ